MRGSKEAWSIRGQVKEMVKVEGSGAHWSALRPSQDS